MKIKRFPQQHEGESDARYELRIQLWATELIEGLKPATRFKILQHVQNTLVRMDQEDFATGIGQYVGPEESLP